MIVYSVDKKENRYVLHKLIITDSGMNIIGIFSGSRNECYKKLAEIRGEKDEKKK